MKYIAVATAVAVLAGCADMRDGTTDQSAAQGGTTSPTSGRRVDANGNSNIPFDAPYGAPDEGFYPYNAPYW